MKNKYTFITKQNKNRIPLFFNFHFSTFNSSKGMALITLLFFSVIAINITAAAVVIVLVNSLSGAKVQQGMIAYQIAESGIEEAKLRLLRDPDYTDGPLTVGGGTANITITRNGTQYTILSKGTVGNFQRKIQAVASYSGSLLIIQSQQEVF